MRISFSDGIFLDRRHGIGHGVKVKSTVETVLRSFSGTNCSCQVTVNLGGGGEISILFDFDSATIDDTGVICGPFVYY